MRSLWTELHYRSCGINRPRPAGVHDVFGGEPGHLPDDIVWKNPNARPKRAGIRWLLRVDEGI
jgi:hypothetical protein